MLFAQVARRTDTAFKIRIEQIIVYFGVPPITSCCKLKERPLHIAENHCMFGDGRGRKPADFSGDRLSGHRSGDEEVKRPGESAPTITDQQMPRTDVFAGLRSDLAGRTAERVSRDNTQSREEPTDRLHCPA